MVKRSSKKQKGGSHELRLETLMGEKISLNVNKKDTIKEIKQELSTRSLYGNSFPPKYIKLIYRGEELKDSDRIEEHYKLGYETKPIRIIVNLKHMNQELASARINLEIAKMFQGSTVRKPQKLEQLQNDLLESIATEIKSKDIPKEYSESIVRADISKNKSGKTKKEKKKSAKKKKKKSSKKQKGGALCVPCISPILSGLGILGAGAAATAAGATAAGAMTMTSSKVVQSGNNIEREQSFEKNTSKTHKKGKKKTDKLKFYISQKNNKVSFKKNNGKLITKTFNKSKNMKTNIKRASQFYDNKIKYCVVKGYKKC